MATNKEGVKSTSQHHCSVLTTAEENSLSTRYLTLTGQQNNQLEDPYILSDKVQSSAFLFGQDGQDGQDASGAKNNPNFDSIFYSGQSQVSSNRLNNHTKYAQISKTYG